MTTAVISAAPARSAQRQSLAGLGTLIGFTLKRNWGRFLVWLVIVVGMMGYIGNFYQTTFSAPTKPGEQSALEGFISTVHSPALTAMVGIISQPESISGAVWCKYWMFGSLMLGIGMLFLMTRNLRADEDQGRAELIRSTPLGIHARLMTSVGWMSVVSIVTGLVAGGVLAAMNLTTDGTRQVMTSAQAANGAMLMGLSMALVGLLGVGIGAVTNELSPSSGAANGIGIAVFGVFYLLRAFGDLGGNALVWLSPMGWAQKTDPWGANRWWLAGVVIVFAAVLVGVAWLIQSRRDLDASVIRASHGHPAASGFLQTIVGLGTRLQRGSLIGWLIGIVVFGGLVSSVMQSMSDMLANSALANGPLGDIVSGGLKALAAGLLVPLIALAISVFAAQSATTLRADEAHGVLEAQLAGAVSRTSWALQRLAITVIGTVVLLLVAGAIVGQSYAGLVAGGSMADIVGAFLAYLPACLLLASVFVLGFGWWPRQSVLVTWIVVGFLWVIMMVGIAIRIPQWFLDLMPFNATPQLPAAAMDWRPIVIMSAIAVVFSAVGLIGLRRRNVPA